MILGIYMTDSGREGIGGILGGSEVLKEICPSCRKPMSKIIEKDNKGGFYYLLKCEDHGLIRRRKPTYQETRIFNE